MINKPKNKLVIKSNKLINKQAFNNTLQFKMFCKVVIAVTINPNKKIYEFNIKDILEEFDAGSENYSYLKKQCKQMFIASVDISTSDDDKFNLRAVFQGISTENNSGLIKFEVDSLVKPYILDYTKGFTRYHLENILRLSSYYSMQMYEILKSYEKIGSRNIKIIDLRIMLNLKEKEYPFYANFKQRILLSSQKELKEKTDIYFTFEEIKRGRKIIEIKFNIFPNNQNKIIENNSKENELIIIKNNKNDLEKNPETNKNDLEKNILLEGEELDLYNQIIEIGVNKKQALLLIKNNDLKNISNNIKYVNNEIKKGKSKDNIAGFLISAIKGNYYNQTELFIEDQKKLKRLKQIELDRKQKEQERLDKIKEQEKSEKERRELFSVLGKEDFCTLKEKIGNIIDNNKTVFNGTNGMLFENMLDNAINLEGLVNGVLSGASSLVIIRALKKEYLKDLSP
jgi:plasmid replication initiation protein